MEDGKTLSTQINELNNQIKRLNNQNQDANWIKVIDNIITDLNSLNSISIRQQTAIEGLTKGMYIF